MGYTQDGDHRALTFFVFKRVRRCDIGFIKDDLSKGDRMSMGIAGVGGTIGHSAVSGASDYASPTAKMSNLFSQIDTTGSGAINQDQFNQAFQTQNPPGVFKAVGADFVFNQLDPQGSGSVSQENFVTGMTGLMRSLRGGDVSPTSASPSSSPMASPADTLSSGLQSLNQLGGSSDPSSSNGLGSIVNILA